MKMQKPKKSNETKSASVPRRQQLTQTKGNVSQIFMAYYL